MSAAITFPALSIFCTSIGNVCFSKKGKKLKTNAAKFEGATDFYICTKYHLMVKKKKKAKDFAL